MSISLIETPERTIRDIVSNVTAGLTQIPYKLQRVDIPSLLGSEDDLGIHLLRFAGDITAILVVSDIINVYGSNLTIKNATVTWLSWDSGASVTWVRIDTAWSEDVGTGFSNYADRRLDYRMLLNIADPVSGVNALPVPLSYIPRSDGSLFANIANMFSAVVRDGNPVNFVLRYAEYYDGTAHNYESAPPIFAIGSKRQFGEIGGANMWRYLPNLATATAGVCNQLTEFFHPFVYIGWRSWLAVIYDENINIRLDNIIVGFRIRATDRNGVLLDEQSFLQLPQNLPRIHVQDIPDELKTVENAYYLSSYLNSGDGAASQNQISIIKKPCFNPMVLEWIGRNGVAESYMFSRSQDIDTEARVGVSYEAPIEDTIDVLSGNLRRTVQGSDQYITLIAENIPRQHVEVLKYMKESPRILLWLDTQGESYVQVIVTGTYSTPIRTKEIFGAYTVQIQLPRNFDILKPAE